MDDKEQPPTPAQPKGKPSFKASVAKQYQMVAALADPDDPEIKAYLAHLAAVLDAPD
jgi:hypothetical protein